MLLTALVASAAARAQSTGRSLLAGGGLGPGLGATATVVEPLLGVLTREGALYADYQPRVLGGRGRLLVAVGAGGSLRLARALGAARSGGARQSAPRYDLDVGVRFGPAFYYAFFEQSADSKSRAFRVMVDPFARGTLNVAGRRVFVEVGAHAPGLRAGLVF